MIMVKTSVNLVNLGLASQRTRTRPVSQKSLLLMNVTIVNCIVATNSCSCNEKLHRTKVKSTVTYTKLTVATNNVSTACY